jgi:hypothetical protein
MMPATPNGVTRARRLEGPADALQYALGRGLIAADEFVRADLQVSDLKLRHRAFVVTRGPRKALFMKQVGSADPLVALPFEHELAFYDYVRDAGPGLALADLVPKPLDVDHRDAVLTLEFMSATDLQTPWLSGSGVFPPSAGLAGQALGRLHSEASRARRLDAFPSYRQPPGPLVVAQLPPSGAPAPIAAVLRHLHRNPQMLQLVDELRRGWRLLTVVHGDIRFTNVLTTTTEARLIDWEHADIGDPAWDVGGMIQPFMGAWVHAMPDHGWSQPSDGVASQPFSVLRPALRQFWSEYRSASPLTDAEAASFLVLATRHAGARLLQTAWEAARSDGHLGSRSLACLQLSHAALTNAAAMLHWLGLA